MSDEEQMGAAFSSFEASGSETSDSILDEKRLQRARKQNERREVQVALYSLSETVHQANKAAPLLNPSNVSVETVIPYAIKTIEKLKGKAKKNRARKRRNNVMIKRNVDLLKSIEMMEQFQKDGIMTQELKDSLEKSGIGGIQSGASGSKDAADNCESWSSGSEEEFPYAD